MNTHNYPASFAAKMDAYLDEYCRLYTFFGILRVTLKDEIIYERSVGFADIEHQIPISADSVFTLYSLSKPFCAIGLLLLADRGLINLDDHPGKYVPEAVGFDGRVTYRHLLQHTSGLPDFDSFPELMKSDNFNLRSIIREMTKAPSHFAPGDGGLYANINFALPALTIENISGMSYADFMKKEVFTPLGMTNAQVDHHRLLVRNRVRGYEINGDGLAAADSKIHEMLGAGDIVGTVNDVYRLNHAIKHKLLLKPETWDMALTPSPVNSYGMGCGVTEWHGKMRINHSGGHLGFRTLHIQLPEDDFDIILLSNCGFGNSRHAISEAVYTAFYGSDAPAGVQIDMDAGYIPSLIDDLPSDFLPERRPRIDFSPEDEAKLLGKYNGMTLTKDGDLYSINLDGHKLSCYPSAPELLVNAYADELYGVRFSDDGKVYVHGWVKTNDFV